MFKNFESFLPTILVVGLASVVLNHLLALKWEPQRIGHEGEDGKLQEIIQRLDQINSTLHLNSQQNNDHLMVFSSEQQHVAMRPKALVMAYHISATHVGHMEEVASVLRSVGFDVTFELPSDTSSLSLIWSFEWPFGHKQLSTIYATQSINHFPNTGVITNKVDLAVVRSGHVPLSFRMPDEYDEWISLVKQEGGGGADAVDVKWLVKSNTHRGISLIDPATFRPTGDAFVQRFIADPLLIDGFKVDLGVYVLITSAVPLRVYVLDHEVWIRACPEPYHPFDATNTRKYVVDAEHRPPWDLPSFAKYFNEGSTLKQAFLTYLASQGFDNNGKALFDKIDESIREIFNLLGHRLASRQDKNRSSNMWTDLGLNIEGASKHFDLIRFDFLIEVIRNKSHQQNTTGKNKSLLKPWLMEVNFSPNLWASKFPQNRRLYRQILFDVFSITGASLNHQPGFFDYNLNEAGLVTVNDLHIQKDVCHDVGDLFPCAGENATMKCLVCSKQWPSSFENSLKQTFSEQLSRRHFRRIVPPEPEVNNYSVEDLDQWLDATGYSTKNKNRSVADRALATWLFLKCQRERRWCS